MADCKAVSLEVSCVLQCNNGEVQRHLRTFYRAMDTSSVHAAYKSGVQIWSDVWWEERGGM